MLSYLLVGLVATAATYGLCFLVRRLAVRFGAVVLPDDRRVHAAPTPTAGGAAMFVAFLAAMAVAWRLPQFDDVFESSSEPLGIVLAVSAIFVVGLVDDLREVSAPAKLAGQVLAGSVMYFLGVTMFFFRVPFGDLLSLSADLQPLITVLWVVAIANAINLIDGLDGLAAGIVLIAASAFFVYSDRLFDAGLIGTENVGPLAAVIAAGICLGFLPHNMHPARIFMGDAGAMVLGVLMASSTIVVGGRIDDQFAGQAYFFFAPMVIPLFILGVPIVDTVFAIVRRAFRRTALSVADKEHLHHRLMRLGHGHRRSVLILWAWTAIFSSLILFPPITGRLNALLPFVAAGLGVALYTAFHPLRQRADAVALDGAQGLEPGMVMEGQELGAGEEAGDEADVAAGNDPGPRRAVAFGARPELADVVHLPERRRRTGRG